MLTMFMKKNMVFEITEVVVEVQRVKQQVE